MSKRNWLKNLSDRYFRGTKPPTEKEMQRTHALERLSKWLDEQAFYTENVLGEHLKKLSIQFGANAAIDARDHATEDKNIFSGFPIEKGKGIYSNFKSFSLSVDIDGGQFSREELTTIARKVETLHDIALEYNVGLEISGFDRLPKVGHATSGGGWHRGGQVSIELNLGAPYQIQTHPTFEGSTSKDLKTRKNAVSNPYMKPKGH